MDQSVAALQDKRIVAIEVERTTAEKDGSVDVDSLRLTLDDGSEVFAYTAVIEPTKRVG